MLHPVVRAVLLFLAFIAGGALLFLLDWYELGSKALATGLLVLLTLGKLTYFVHSLLRWVRHSTRRHEHRQHLLLFVLLSVLLIIGSYSIDYYCLNRIHPHSFHLPFGQQDPVAQLVTFFYLSAGRFTTAGGSEVYATTTLAQAYLTSEILLAYFTTVLLIANLGMLQALFAPKRRPLDQPD